MQWVPSVFFQSSGLRDVCCVPFELSVPAREFKTGRFRGMNEATQHAYDDFEFVSIQ
jgi:hypothetical protein